MADRWGNVSLEPMTVPVQTKQMLTVSEIERMAKAGVKIEFKEIAEQVRPDPEKYNTIFGQIDEMGWLRDFLRRWDRAKPAPRDQLFSQSFAHVSITRTDDTFHVFVLTMAGKAAHLTDDAAAFPSEALIAKILFLEKEGKTP